MSRLSLLAAVVLTAVAGGLGVWDPPHELAIRRSAGTTIRSGFVRPAVVGPGDLEVEVPGPFRLMIDGRLVLERTAEDRSASASTGFAFGVTPHFIELSQVSDVTPQWRWMAASAHVATPIPAAAFSPISLGGLGGWVRRIRRWVATGALFAWVWLMLWMAWRWIDGGLPGAALEWSGPIVTVLVAAAVLMGIGLWWAWPPVPWAPDELWPSTVLNGVAHRFSGGWFDLYPPGHFYLLAAVYSPALALQALGLLPLEAASLNAALHLMGRLVSVCMALGIVAMVARLAQQMGGVSQAWTAAMCATASLPFVFYGRLGNLDVPYLFWFCASLLFFRAAVEERRTRDLVGVALTAATAVLTKDQAYGLYVLPSAWLAWRVLKAGDGTRPLVIAALTAVATFVLGHNLFFNWSGFGQHVASITGGGSETYRMVPASPGGMVSLAGIVAGHLWWALGVPGVALVVMGAWNRPASAWIPAWIWLFPVSYLLMFVGVVGYSYDRFLLPVTLVVGLVGGSGLRWILTAGETSRPTRWAAYACVAWLVWRVASVDVLLLRDSRYQAESWLMAAVPHRALVASVWQAGYQPRLDSFRHQAIEPSAEATARAAPDFIVVNSEFVRRYPDAAPMPTWLRWLESAESGYLEAWRWKDPLRGTELAWWPTFTDRRESTFTNLDKVNPEIVVFRRK